MEGSNRLCLWNIGGGLVSHIQTSLCRCGDAQSKRQRPPNKYKKLAQPYNMT
ncbi:hypothetical protein I79_015691 [Cricetulus griseus]|uniref:Uncharacterized protein n=1 Tax=Cricetulus griseus TaxID=10029 RepID=G3HXG8_CRIGR|nr:hypothetical protein I79_015691 [Cricetulus griseus]